MKYVNINKSLQINNLQSYKQSWKYLFEFVKNDISYLRIEILLFQFIKSGRRFLRGTTATPYHVYIQSKIPSVPLQVVVDVVVVDVVVVLVNVVAVAMLGHITFGCG